jgi:hypothetical protein
MVVGSLPLTARTSSDLRRSRERCAQWQTSWSATRSWRAGSRHTQALLTGRNRWCLGDAGKIAGMRTQGYLKMGRVRRKIAGP